MGQRVTFGIMNVGKKKKVNGFGYVKERIFGEERFLRILKTGERASKSGGFISK